jgi:hypothetical protein
MNKQEQEAWDRMQEDFGKISEHKPIPSIDELLSKIDTKDLKIDTSNWDKVTCTDNSPTLFEPNHTITLSNKDNKEVGKLDFNGDKLKFEGDVEESAKIFFDFLLSTFNQRIEEIREESFRKSWDMFEENAEEIAYRKRLE